MSYLDSVLSSFPELLLPLPDLVAVAGLVATAGPELVAVVTVTMEPLPTLELRNLCNRKRVEKYNNTIITIYL
jgi:hypothetical protein